MSAPPDVYESAFVKVEVLYGASLSQRERAAMAIGLDHAWDVATERIKFLVDGETLQQGQDGTPPDDVIVMAVEVERALGICPDPEEDGSNAQADL